MVDEMKRSIDVLLQRAVDAGSVRSDVSTDEMIGLVVGACQAAATPATTTPPCSAWCRSCATGSG